MRLRSLPGLLLTGDNTMAYCTVNDLKTRFSEKLIAELSSDHSGNSVDSDVVEALIADADAVIDMHLRARYTLPFASTPQVILRISCDLVMHSLYARRSNETPEDIIEAQQRAMEMLKQIQSGDIKLGSDYASAGSRYKANKSLSKNQEFDLETMGDFYQNNEDNTANV